MPTAGQRSQRAEPVEVPYCGSKSYALASRSAIMITSSQIDQAILNIPVQSDNLRAGTFGDHSHVLRLPNTPWIATT